MLRTFDLRLKPKAAQRCELERILADSVETYNPAWQEHREAWKLCQKRIPYYDQQAELTELRCARIRDSRRALWIWRGNPCAAWSVRLKRSFGG
jgi:hypothetical protein